MSSLIHIAVIGHVDHGKSTLIGRLLHETKALPEGKIREIELYCRNHAKPFEYAFLLDALKEERHKGITIDVSRAHFKLGSQEYVFIDCPGHEEFLRNMITGAARADIALLCVDASEGIKENSKRHMLLLSLLGIRKLIVVVNKMDLVSYSQSSFNSIALQIKNFLGPLKLEAEWIIPVSAYQGENLLQKSKTMPWYPSLSLVDSILECTQNIFDLKSKGNPSASLQAFVQDVYKFTKNKDQRRIVAGHLESGTLCTGDEIIFFPSLKKAHIKQILNTDNEIVKTLSGPSPFGLILDQDINIDRGQTIALVDSRDKREDSSNTSKKLRVQFFWMGMQDLKIGDRLKLKVNTYSSGIRLKSIIKVVSSINLEEQKNQNSIESLSVADVIIEADEPIYLDANSFNEINRRFVLIKDFQIQGGGQFLELLKEEVENLRPALSVRTLGQLKFSVAITRNQQTQIDCDVDIDLNQFQVWDESLALIINSYRLLGHKVVLRFPDSKQNQLLEFLKNSLIPFVEAIEKRISNESENHYV